MPRHSVTSPIREPDHAGRANKGSFLQGYNAQAAVDATAQVIVAAEITQQANDSRQLIPMLKQVEANMGRKPDAVSAGRGLLERG